MTNIRRYNQKEDIVFLTHVTAGRAPILVENADLLRAAIDKHLEIWQAELIAWVILPDHLHLLLDTKQAEMSSLMRKIKLSFSAEYRRKNGLQSAKIWQNRFWDHIIRDERDFNRHIDYIHYNPVKHGLVDDPFRYEFSSLGLYFINGYYAQDWGKELEIDATVEYGE